jgi:hypothetical protein
MMLAIATAVAQVRLNGSRRLTQLITYWYVVGIDRSPNYPLHLTTTSHFRICRSTAMMESLVILESRPQ